MDKSAIIGDTVLLPCRVLHKVGPLQWTRDGFGLGPDRKLEGFARYEMIGSDEEGDFSLQIKSVSLEDDATYQCQVGAADGVGGIRSRDAALIVFVPPEPPKIVQGDFLRTTAGVTVELTCESHGGKPAAEVRLSHTQRQTHAINLSHHLLIIMLISPTVFLLHRSSIYLLFLSWPFIPFYSLSLFKFEATFFYSSSTHYNTSTSLSSSL